MNLIPLYKAQPPFMPYKGGHGFLGVLMEDIDTGRILPRIAEKKEWSENGLWGTADDIARRFMLADSQEEGMKEVEDYLMKLL